MKRITLGLLAGAVLLTGCANTNPSGENTVADQTYTPTGTYIARKGPSKGDVATVDKQALENDRTMGNGAINLPQR
jgi:PBP1b-binding outer membrane lipoprotein LpoB